MQDGLRRKRDQMCFLGNSNQGSNLRGRQVQANACRRLHKQDGGNLIARPKGVSLPWASSPDGLSWYLISDDANNIPHSVVVFGLELNGESASARRIRHIISDKVYAADFSLWKQHPWLYITESHLGSSLNVMKHMPCVCLIKISPPPPSGKVTVIIILLFRIQFCDL